VPAAPGSAAGGAAVLPGGGAPGASARLQPDDISNDAATAATILDRYLEAGGNFLDTADQYSRFIPGNRGGESESIIGSWLKARGNRGQVILATKVGAVMGDDPNERGLSRRHIMRSIEASLRRLQTDYVDLYYAHFDDLDTSTDEFMRAFDDLVRQGKVVYPAVSNLPPWRVVRAQWSADAHGYARFECLQPEYSLVARERFEREYEPICQDLGLGVAAYYALAAGFLTGKYRRGEPPPSTPRARGVQAKYVGERGFAVLDELSRVAGELEATPARVALAWLMARPSVTCAIASARDPGQVRELLGAAEVRLPAEALAALDRVSDWRPEGQR
jgi:aryl-alcohol dehydrogenase-like predicted oxidoreductase